MEFLTPPPVRWLPLDDDPLPAGAPPGQPSWPDHGRANGLLEGIANGNGNGSARGRGGHAAADPTTRPRPARSPSVAIDRMQVDEVTIAYGQKPAVRAVSLPIRQGEVLALIGPSGCGKTTLLRSLNRLTELTKGASMRGRITLDGGDITTIEPTLLRRRVTMVFQQPNPFPMSVFDNVAYVLREQGSRRPGKRALREPVLDALERAGLLEEVKDSLDHPALRLSGGQQQRLCIARALAVHSRCCCPPDSRSAG